MSTKPKFCGQCGTSLEDVATSKITFNSKDRLYNIQIDKTLITVPAHLITRMQCAKGKSITLQVLGIGL